MAHNKSFSAGHSYGLPVVDILFFREAYEVVSNTGAPHFSVVVISANNAQKREEERASSGHYIHEACNKMAAERL